MIICIDGEWSYAPCGPLRADPESPCGYEEGENRYGCVTSPGYPAATTAPFSCKIGITNQERIGMDPAQLGNAGKLELPEYPFLIRGRDGPLVNYDVHGEITA